VYFCQNGEINVFILLDVLPELFIVFTCVMCIIFQLKFDSQPKCLNNSPKIYLDFEFLYICVK